MAGCTRQPPSARGGRRRSYGHQPVERELEAGRALASGAWIGWIGGRRRYAGDGQQPDADPSKRGADRDHQGAVEANVAVRELGWAARTAALLDLDEGEGKGTMVGRDGQEDSSYYHLAVAIPTEQRSLMNGAVGRPARAWRCLAGGRRGRCRSSRGWGRGVAGAAS